MLMVAAGTNSPNTDFISKPETRTIYVRVSRKFYLRLKKEAESRALSMSTIMTLILEERYKDDSTS